MWEIVLDYLIGTILIIIFSIYLVVNFKKWKKEGKPSRKLYYINRLIITASNMFLIFAGVYLIAYRTFVLLN